MEENCLIWTARTAPGRLPEAAGGSFASKADVLQWLGWSLEVIAERERDEERKREFGDWRARRASAGRQERGPDEAWKRFRTWGKPLMQALERSRACARIAYYVFRSQANAGEFDAAEGFQDLFNRAAFVVGGVLNRSEKYLWKLRNEVWEFVNNLWKREKKVEGLTLKGGRTVNKSEALNQADFQDTRVRVNNSKNVKGFLNMNFSEGEDFEGAPEARAVKTEAIPKFTGRLRGRGSVWRVFEAAHDAAKRAHGSWYWEGEDSLYSGKHLFSWLRACFVAGRDLKAAARLYASAVDRHRGTGSGKAYLPKMFARLYREAAELPRWERSREEPRINTNRHEFLRKDITDITS